MSAFVSLWPNCIARTSSSDTAGSLTLVPRVLKLEKGKICEEIAQYERITHDFNNFCLRMKHEDYDNRALKTNVHLRIRRFRLLQSSSCLQSIFISVILVCR
jgi:hypothetical protein